MADDIPEFVDKEPIIMNTDLSDGQGIHWIVLFPFNGTVYIFDSLGKNNIRMNDKIMFEQIKEQGYNYKFYPYSYQYRDDSLCGWFSIFVASVLKKHSSSISENNVFSIIHTIFNDDADDDDILVLMKAFGMKDKNHIDHVLDELDIEGEGVIKEIKSRVNGLLDAIKGVRMNFPPRMRNILNQYGNLPIAKAYILRKPIQSFIDKALSVINKLTGYNTPSYDKLFHLFAVFTLSNGTTVLIEKNQVLNAIVNYKQQKGDEMVQVPVPGTQWSINKLLNNAISKYGKNEIFHYSGLDTNCQRFIYDLLSASWGISSKTKAFVMQPVSNLLNRYGRKILNAATDLSSKIDLVKNGEGIIKLL